MKKIMAFLAALGMTACTSALFAAANLPAQGARNFEMRQAAYGSEPWQALDLYIPKNTKAEAPRDVVVFFHGGRWTTGKKENYKFVGAALAEKGFIVAIPDYRKYPDVKFPGFMEDGAKAMAWTADNIAHYGGDPQRIHVAGHSSGAHMGALLSADESYLARHGKKTSAVIKSFAGLAGPYDFTPDEPDLIDLFGPPDRYPQMQVPTFIDRRDPPMLLQYGEDDETVAAYNHQRLAKRIREKGGTVEVITYPGLGHTQIIGTFSWAGPKSAVVDDMAAFFRK